MCGNLLLVLRGGAKRDGTTLTLSASNRRQRNGEGWRAEEQTRHEISAHGGVLALLTQPMHVVITLVRLGFSSI